MKLLTLSYFRQKPVGCEKFDHLVFTGSTQVGRAVMRAASENLDPVTLELSGKSPAIVAKGFSLDRAAMGIAYGKLANVGQTCVAPDYALVPEQELERFIAGFDRAVDAPSRVRTLAPTLVLDVNDDMKIMQDEIFGPVLPVKTYRSLGEAIDYVNAHPRPLALYYFGRNDEDRSKILSRTTSGNVTINSTLTH